MNIQKIKNHAGKLYNAMDWKDRGDDKIAVISERSGKNYEELLKITFIVNEKTNLSMDSTYRFTMEALGMISDSTGEDEEGLRESLDEIESDAYASSLTSWLNESNYHVYYLEEAQEYGKLSGFELLSIAQQKAKQEVATIVLDYLLEK